MKSTSFYQFFRRYWIPFALVLVILLVAAAFFLSRCSPMHLCTLIGCQDSLELTLSHEPPMEYTVLLTADNGETHSITCTPGSISGFTPTTAMCSAGKVTFFGFSPTDVSVAITWQGGSYSTSGHPAYTSLQPNGPDCPPTCQSGKLSLALP